MTLPDLVISLTENLDRFIYGFVISRAFVSGIDKAAAPGPSFNCKKAAGMIEKPICGDDGLAALDRKLPEAHAVALKKLSASTRDSAKHGYAQAYKDLYDAYQEAVKNFN
jgi:uncharacterized protein